MIRGLIRVYEALKQFPLGLKSHGVLQLIVQNVANADQVERVEAHDTRGKCELPVLTDPSDHGERNCSDRHQRKVAQTVEPSCALASGHWCHHRG